MGSFRIELKGSVEKDLRRLPPDTLARISHKIATLAANPLSSPVRKLEGTDTLYRIRVGDYRIIYSVDLKQRLVVVQTVRHRKDAYRRA